MLHKKPTCVQNNSSIPWHYNGDVAQLKLSDLTFETARERSIRLLRVVLKSSGKSWVVPGLGFEETCVCSKIHDDADNISMLTK